MSLQDGLKRLIELNEQIEVAKELYNERDKLVLALKELGFTSQVVNGKEYLLVDNFESKNTAWRMAAVNRFEIKVKKDKGDK